MRLAVLALSLGGLVSLAQAAPEQANFCVLKITQGEKVTYKAIPSKDASTEKRRVATDAAATLKTFKEKAAAFRKEHKNGNKPFPALEPEASSVAVEKDALPSQEEAEALAQERQQKADEAYAVVRIQDVDGHKTLEAIPQSQVRSREEALYAEYVQAAEKAANKDPERAEFEGNVGPMAGLVANAGHGDMLQGMEKAPTKPVLTTLVKNLPGKDKATEILKGLKN